MFPWVLVRTSPHPSAPSLRPLWSLQVDRRLRTPPAAVYWLKCYCKPWQRATRGQGNLSVISQGALLFPIVTTNLWGNKKNLWPKCKLLHKPLRGEGGANKKKTCFGLRYKDSWQVYSSCCEHETLCQSDTTCERYVSTINITKNGCNLKSPYVQTGINDQIKAVTAV